MNGHLYQGKTSKHNTGKHKSSHARYTHILIVSRAFNEGPPGGPGAEALGMMSRTNSSTRRCSIDISGEANPSPMPVPYGNGFFDATVEEGATRVYWVPMTSQRRERSMTESFALNVGVWIA